MTMPFCADAFTFYSVSVFNVKIKVEAIRLNFKYVYFRLISPISIFGSRKPIVFTSCKEVAKMKL